MHGRLNDAAQLGGGRRRHLRKNLSALGFIRLRFAGLRARAQALRLSTPAAIVMLLATIVLMAVTTTPPAAAARQAHPAQPMEADAPREAGKPIMAIVSIKTQQVTFYDADGWIYRAPVSTGTTGRETPAGVFAVLEKNKDHHSSLYDDAWMPNMLRITWNGLALHGGPLPGYAASHGCVRMPYDFAEKVFDKVPMGMRVLISPSDVEPVEFSSSSLFMPNRETIAAMPAKAVALAREADEATKAAAIAKTALGSAKRGAAAALATVRKLEYFKKHADGELADAEKVLAAARTDAAKAAAENVKQKATAKIEELSTQLDAAMADERTTQNAVAAAEAIAKTTEAKRIEADKAANDAKLALEPVSVYISRATQKLYVRRDTHMRAPDGGEMYDTTIELPVTIKDPDKPIGTHIFTVVARTDAALRWTEVTIDNGDDAKDALDRITLPQEILDRIAPTATPRSSIIISDEPMSSETNYRTEFVVVLNDQPQGGFANRARSPGMRFARRDGFGFNRLGDWFFGDSRPPHGQSYGRRQGWGW
jgi:lipoprotein-anchoring transpeptidase ErfK/SrfK